MFLFLRHGNQGEKAKKLYICEKIDLSSFQIQIAVEIFFTISS